MYLIYMRHVKDIIRVHKSVLDGCYKSCCKKNNQTTNPCASILSVLVEYGHDMSLPRLFEYSVR